MMDITKLRKIGPTLQREMDEVLKRHGLTMTDRRAVVYGNGEVKWTMNFHEASVQAVDQHTVGQAGTIVPTDPRVQDWNRYAVSFGLRKEWLGQEFRSGQKTLVVVGLDPKKPVWAVRVRDKATDKVLIMKCESLAQHMTGRA